jgi:hypothetical protein
MSAPRWPHALQTNQPNRIAPYEYRGDGTAAGFGKYVVSGAIAFRL